MYRSRSEGDGGGVPVGLEVGARAERTSLARNNDAPHRGVGVHLLQVGSQPFVKRKANGVEAVRAVESEREDRAVAVGEDGRRIGVRHRELCRFSTSCQHRAIRSFITRIVPGL